MLIIVSIIMLYVRGLAGVTPQIVVTAVTEPLVAAASVAIVVWDARAVCVYSY
jgi:hypothetical protein